MHNRCFYIEAELCQETKALQNVCGDSCESRKLKEEDRLITVLSDGLGSGVKANILATMTTSMALQFTAKNDPLEHTSDFIMNTLPVDSKRQISYSTFSILDINCFGDANIVEYDNPPILIYRNGDFIDLKPTAKRVQRPEGQSAEVLYSSLKLLKEDRIIMVSDGITQSGMGNASTPFGWGTDGLKQFIKQNIKSCPDLSARQLARKIMQRAKANDANSFKDDATCQVIYCREPRKLVLASGPPYYKNCDALLAERIDNFRGKKIICGGTTSKIISRELKREIRIELNNYNPELPPIAEMEGIDLITEGILTLGKVSSILEQLNSHSVNGDGPAERMVKLFLDSDSILILAGTQINNAHQDPNLPVELEIRRNIIKKIAAILEDKFLKTLEIEYL
ncbi:SpoIIE family protein phosphatase [Carboxylicivirga mesophila]|uniref:SpoIIE family protein phosphatase n=1 Tax=Carboxylicivirga mesophila TaxID=1166478 RepID=A0ABS5KF53_9BACT|nr:SpoIIE family protein phosphatase [Carboxylicivirga mesophila]MBS2213151.1 SpoIIE family protein phosphatase [Carboxylicivirga mesophila]